MSISNGGSSVAPMGASIPLQVCACYRNLLSPSKHAQDGQGTNSEVLAEDLSFRTRACASAWRSRRGEANKNCSKKSPCINEGDTLAQRTL